MVLLGIVTSLRYFWHIEFFMVCHMGGISVRLTIGSHTTTDLSTLLGVVTSLRCFGSSVDSAEWCRMRDLVVAVIAVYPTFVSEASSRPP